MCLDRYLCCIVSRTYKKARYTFFTSHTFSQFLSLAWFCMVHVYLLCFLLYGILFMSYFCLSCEQVAQLLLYTILLIILGMWSFGTSLTDSYEVACAWSLKEILRKDWNLLLFSVAIRFFTCLEYRWTSRL